MENNNIESLNESNIDELYYLLLELIDYHNNISTYFKGKYPSKPLNDIIIEIKNKVQNGNSKVDGIRIDKKIIAFSIYFIENNVGILEYIVTSKKHRNKGYGKKLMENVMLYFKTANVKRIEIRMVYGNDNAIKFYSKFGFKIQSEILAIYLQDKT